MHVPRAEGEVMRILPLSSQPKDIQFIMTKKQGKTANPHTGEAGTRERLAFFLKK